MRAAIVNTVSSAGLQGNVGQANYGAAKAGIAALTIITSLEGARYGVRANAVAPGGVTRLTGGVLKDVELNEPEEYTEFSRLNPQNSAPMVAWLASDEALHVTGQVFRAVGANIAHYEPWQLGASDRQPQGRGEVGPGHHRPRGQRPRLPLAPPRPQDGRRLSPAVHGQSRTTKEIARWRPPGGHRRRGRCRTADGSTTRRPSNCTTRAPRRALADAGIDKSEVDGFMSHGTGALPPIELAEYLGLRPNWVDSTGHGGSIWEFMTEHAAAAIAQGLVEVVVLSYGSTQRADLKKKLRMANLSFGTRGPIQFDAPFGHPVGSRYAMAARRHMHEFGTTIEQLAEIAVSTRYNAGFNPEAYYREPITIDDVLAVDDDLGPADQAPLLHPLRRRRVDRAHQRGAGPGLRQGPGLGARHRRGESRTPP